MGLENAYSYVHIRGEEHLLAFLSFHPGLLGSRVVRPNVATFLQEKDVRQGLRRG